MTTYYVDFTLGDDAKNGESEPNAWKTISKVNGESFNAGDIVKFKCGEEWRGVMLAVNSDGGTGNHIVISTYGSGADPIINGSVLKTGWEPDIDTGTNYCVNGGFETAGAGDPDIFANWAETENGTSDIIDNTTDQRSGSHCCELVIDASNNIARVASSTMVIGASQYVQLTIYYYNSAVGKTARIQFYDSAGNQYLKEDGTWNAGVYSIVLPNQTGSYAQYQISFTTHASYTDYKLRLFNSSAASSSIYFDDVTVYKRSENIWKVTGVTTDPRTGVWMDNNWGDEKGSVGALVNEYDFYYDGATTLYIYSATDPDTAYTSPGVEAAQGNHCVHLKKDYITYQNLELTKSRWSGFMCDDSARATEITIDSILIHYFPEMGISGNSDIGESPGFSNDDWIIKDCEVTQCAKKAINFIGRAADWIIQDNLIYSCSFTSGADGAGIKFNSWFTGDSTGHIIQRNVVHDIGPDDDATAGIWVDNTVTHCIIRYNLVYNIVRNGILIESCSHIKAYYNIVYNCDKFGIGIKGNATAIPGVNSEYNELYNNVIYACNVRCAIAVGKWTAADIGGSYVQYNKTKNNIVFGCAEVLECQFGGDNDGIHGSNNEYEYNCFGVEAANFIQWGAATWYSTYDAWETAYGGSTHSVEADPLMVNPGAGDFSLQEGSPCRDVGIYVGLTKDIVGTSVPQNLIVDVGAYEFIYELPLPPVSSSPRLRGGWRYRETRLVGIEAGLPEYKPTDLELKGFKIKFYDLADNKLYELGSDVKRGRISEANFELMDFGCGEFSFVLDNKPPFDLTYRIRVDIHLYFDEVAWFTGFIQAIPQPGQKTPFEFSGFGFFEQLDWVTVTDNYAALDVADIVKDIVQNKVAPNTQIIYNAAKVEATGYTVNSIDFYLSYAKDAIQSLADIAQGFEFGVDNVREFYFRPIDTDLKYHCWAGKQFQHMKIEEDPFAVRNRLYIKVGLIQGEGFGYIKEGSNCIGYVEDAASIATYGLREDVVTAPDVLDIDDAERWATMILDSRKIPAIKAKINNVIFDKTKTKIDSAGKVRVTAHEGSEYELKIERVAYSISSQGILGNMELES